MASSSKAAAPRSTAPAGLTKLYLFAYNTTNLILWASVFSYAASLLPSNAKNNLSAIFGQTFPPLLWTQSVALLEVFHSLVGLVRAPVMTTGMQVASRLLVVWGILANYGGDIVGGAQTQIGDYAYLGCVTAWGVTEVIRYGFFAISLSGNSVPSWWTWLRYNTFYILYPIGISSECTLIFQAIRHAVEIDPIFRCVLIIVLVVYVPGSYILYTHMIAQRRKVLRGKKRSD